MIAYRILPGRSGFKVVETITGEAAKVIVEFATEAAARGWLDDHLKLLGTTDMAAMIRTEEDTAS
jgi:hypothetical protein